MNNPLEETGESVEPVCKNCSFWHELNPIANQRAGACKQKANYVRMSIGMKGVSDPVPDGKFHYETCAYFQALNSKEGDCE